VASTLRNGALASLANRRAISVLPQPVGPIIRMFLGSTSSRSVSGSCRRRQRLRSAMATARLASCWPTMCLSSSETISRGEKSLLMLLKLLDDEIVVGVDADVGGDIHRLARDRLGVQPFDVDQGARRRQRVVAARTDGDDA